MNPAPHQVGPGEPLWRWVLRYALRRRGALALLVALMLVDAGCQALMPWPVKILIDYVLGQRTEPAWLRVIAGTLPGAGSREGLLAWCVLSMVALFLIVAMLGVAQAAVGTTAGQRMAYDVAADLFAHLQRLSLRSHGRRSVGDLMRRVTADCGVVTVIVRDAALPGVAAGVTIAAVFVLMLSMSVSLALLAITAVPILAVVVWRCTQPVLDRGYEYAQAEAGVWDIVEEALTAAPAVQAFAAADEMDRRVGATYDSVLASAVALSRGQFRLKILSGSVTVLVGAVLMTIGTRQVLAGTATVGSLVAFLSYLAILYAPLDTIAHSLGSGGQAAGAARRIMQVLAEHEEVSDRPGAHPLVRPRDRAIGLMFDSVTFGYEPGRPVLLGVDIRVPAGATLALVGPSGSGKSTLAALIPRLIDPWEGGVMLDGRDLREFTLRSLRRHVAMVLQETFLFPATISDNIAYGRPDASRAEIETAARAAGAHPFIEKLPDGYDTVLGERGATLSGGERQRLAIARALLKDAPILVLDEPTSALDASTEAGVRRALDLLRRGRTTLLIAHRLATVRGADLIGVLDRGRLVELGSHQDLLSRGGVYAHLCNLQSGDRT